MPYAPQGVKGLDDDDEPARKSEVAGSSRTFVSLQQATRRHVPIDFKNIDIQLRQDIKCYRNVILFVCEKCKGMPKLLVTRVKSHQAFRLQ
jgi:hypothetical protein